MAKNRWLSDFTNLSASVGRPNRSGAEGQATSKIITFFVTLDVFLEKIDLYNKILNLWLGSIYNVESFFIITNISIEPIGIEQCITFAGYLTED
ncbi:MAG: hypothetical protein A4S09_13525 [Proteobacteria bacterium SG_bin7]|nr:MAG: hypothetical protein A4S09_13525 [Proteobacteria bacterium SG_bin7]